MIIVLGYDDNTYIATLQVDNYNAQIYYANAQMNDLVNFIKLVKQVSDITLVFTYDMPTLKAALKDVEIIK